MSSSLNRISLIAAVVSAFFILTPCWAQNAKAAAGSASPAMAAIANSRGPFAAGDYATADALLVADNISSPGSGAWYLESGIKLMHLATSFANRHDPVNMRLAAQRAVATLQTAEDRLVSEHKPATAARADELIGVINELLLHDDAAASTAYRRALVQNPNAADAKNAAARLSSKKG